MDAALKTTTDQGGAAIEFDADNLLTLDTHPLSPLIACGTIEGSVSVYNYCTEDCEEAIKCSLKGSLEVSKESCRCVRFSNSGKSLFCALKDKSWQQIDTSSWTVSSIRPDVHSSSLNAVHVISERLVATGDENGCIKVWDTRTRREVLAVSENTDFISDMISDSERQSLLCTSGDGSLSVVDLRQRKLEQRSDCSESELFCIAKVKGSRRVVCGDGEGFLGIFMWGLWGDVVDRYRVALSSVDCCVQISDSMICTGGLDGKIRVVQILPNKVVCELGDHGSNYPIENLRVSHDDSHVFSGSYNSIRCWSTTEVPSVWIPEPSVDTEDREEAGGQRKRGGRKRRRKRRKNELLESIRGPKKRDTFFDDL